MVTAVRHKQVAERIDGHAGGVVEAGGGGGAVLPTGGGAAEEGVGPRPVVFKLADPRDGGVRHIQVAGAVHGDADGHKNAADSCHVIGGDSGGAGGGADRGSRGADPEVDVVHAQVVTAGGRVVVFQPDVEDARLGEPPVRIGEHPGPCATGRKRGGGAEGLPRGAVADFKDEAGGIVLVNFGDVGLKPVGGVRLGNADRHRLPHRFGGVRGGIGDKEFAGGCAQGLVVRSGKGVVNLRSLGHDRIEAFGIKSLRGRCHVTISAGEVGVAGLEVSVPDQVPALPSPTEASQPARAVHHGGDGEGAGGRDLADPGVVGVRHPDGSGAVHRDAAGVAEPCRRSVAVGKAVRGAGDGRDSRGGNDHFPNPVIARVGHEQFSAGGVDRQGLRTAEAGGGAAGVGGSGRGGSGHRGDHPGRGNDLADLVVAGVGHVQVGSGGIHHDTGGRAEPGSGSRAVGAARRPGGSGQGGDSAAGVDFPDHVVGGVGNVDVPVGVHCRGAGAAEGGGGA